jgi:hypothetical protein
MVRDLICEMKDELEVVERRNQLQKRVRLLLHFILRRTVRGIWLDLNRVKYGERNVPYRFDSDQRWEWHGDPSRVQ